MCYRVLSNIHYAEPNQILLSLKGKKPHINQMKIYFAELIDKQNLSLEKNVMLSLYT